VHNPQEASKMLVDHALSKFSTDNLSVMVVRFDPKKVKENTSIDIGVQNESSKGTVSEAEMIVSEARRHSNIPPEGAALTEQDHEEIKNMVIEEHDEGQEPGPELTPQGKADAEKAVREHTQVKPHDNAS
jgi:protein phosphatase PTC1